jgi:hypothetical protein
MLEAHMKSLKIDEGKFVKHRSGILYELSRMDYTWLCENIELEGMICVAGGSPSGIMALFHAEHPRLGATRYDFAIPYDILDSQYWLLDAVDVGFKINRTLYPQNLAELLAKFLIDEEDEHTQAIYTDREFYGKAYIWYEDGDCYADSYADGIGDHADAPKK